VPSPGIEALNEERRWLRSTGRCCRAALLAATSLKRNNVPDMVV